MTDAHCHLTDPQFHGEVPTIIDRAREAGVSRIICNGAGVESSIEAITISQNYPEVWATVGVHPEDIQDMHTYGEDGLLDLLVSLSRNPRVIAIGEAGLDYTDHTTEEDKILQRRLLQINIRASCISNKPLVIHNRNADEDIWSLLHAHPTPVQYHCFNSTHQFMEKAVARGDYISFGGIVTFKKSDTLRGILSAVPENQLLLETDAPYLSPEPLRGSRNEPKNVTITAELAARVRGCLINQIQKIVDRNADRLFFHT